MRSTPKRGQRADIAGNRDENGAAGGKLVVAAARRRTLRSYSFVSLLTASHFRRMHVFFPILKTASPTAATSAASAGKHELTTDHSRAVVPAPLHAVPELPASPVACHTWNSGVPDAA